MFCYEGVECCRLLLTINISDIGAMHIGLGALERRKLDLKSRMDFRAGLTRRGPMSGHARGCSKTCKNTGPGEGDGRRRKADLKSRMVF